MSELRNNLTGALIGLAKACENNPKTAQTDSIIIKGLSLTMPNANVSEDTIEQMLSVVKEEKNTIVPNCSCCGSPCGNTSDYDINQIWNAEETIRSLKTILLFGIRNMSAYVYQAMEAGEQDKTIYPFFYKALAILSYDLEADVLLSIVMEMGEMNEKCVALLKKSNITFHATTFPVFLPSNKSIT